MTREKEAFSPLYAHTKPGSPSSDSWQLLTDHLTETASLAAGQTTSAVLGEKTGFAADFNSSCWAFAAGILHDLGKAAPEFQDYLKEAAGQEGQTTGIHCPINHSEAGAAWAESERDPFCGRTLAYLVAGHHAGLPDYEGDGNASLRIRLERGKKNLAAIRDRIEPLVRSVPEPKRFMTEIIRLGAHNYHLWVRFLFSCLVDADYLNTEQFVSPDRAKNRPVFPSLDTLSRKFFSAMNAFKKPDDETLTPTQKILNRSRNDVFNACVQAGRESGSSGSGGIYTLTVPTGGGKTLSSMAFALTHALCCDKSRIIYVIPYTSIVEQTADVFRKIFGSGNVLEHHSNFDAEKYDSARSREKAAGNESDPISSEQMELATENWDAPIVVTTNVQFFESLFAARAKPCRKLHHIVNSVVILDEAQMLKPGLLSPCVDVMNALAGSFGVTWVICTATQPTLDCLDQTGNSGLRYAKLNSPQRIIPAVTEEKLYQDLIRVHYTFDEPGHQRNWPELARELASYDEVLCVVNTRRDCYNLYQELSGTRSPQSEESSDWGTPDLPETVHLSALMCGEHRSRVIAALKERLRTNRENAKKGHPITPIRVISTQLVEAGVDLDFPVVYRALAGLDSITQAAGRCNRESLLGHAGGKVVVFNPPKGAPSGLLRKGEQISREFLKDNQELDPNNPDTMNSYFQNFYSAVVSLDEKNIVARLTRNVGNSPEVPFRSVGEDFRLIDDDYTAAVVVQYGKGGDLIRRLEQEGPHLDLMRQIQRFTINLPQTGPTGVATLIRDGKLRELYPGIIVQQMPKIYDERIGLDIFSENLPADAVIV